MRLWQRLFLVIAAVGSVAVIAVLLAQQQAFRHGFVDYLNTLEAQRVEEIRARLVAYYREDPQWWSLRHDPRRWGELSGLPLPPRLRPEDPEQVDDFRPRRFDRPPQRREPLDEQDPQRPRPPRGAGGDLGGRLQLFDADGERVAGAPQVPPDAKLARWPIEVDGAVVGELRLATVKSPMAELDREFARSQTRRGLWTAALLVPLALLAALLFARLALRPLAKFAQGFHELASGRFDSRIERVGRDEFGALAADFNRLAEALARQRDSQREYIADVAHELRTPIAILRGELHALEDGVRPLDRVAVDSLSGEVARLTRLVEDLHLLAQSDTGALSYRMQRLDLAELLRESAQTWAPQFERAGLALQLDLRGDAAWIEGDEERLQQLLANLLANSLRYTDAPGRVELGLRRNGRDWQVTVADSAPGVPAAALPRLFERLYRVDGSRARSHGGAGLGLAIAARIAEAHRGRIGASASALGGLAICVDLPAAAAP
jgi:two-component system sensor histidine kinase BaeS